MLSRVTATRWVQGGDVGFWAYDTALALFLDTLIGVAQDEPAEPWLHDAIEHWKEAKAVSDFGLRMPEGLSASQKTALIAMIDRACRRLAADDILTSADIEARGIFPRGEAEVRTLPVVELGRAIAEIVRGSLPSPPFGTAWFFGGPGGRTTLPMRTA